MLHPFPAGFDIFTHWIHYLPFCSFHLAAQSFIAWGSKCVKCLFLRQSPIKMLYADGSRLARRRPSADPSHRTISPGLLQVATWSSFGLSPGKFAASRSLTSLLMQVVQLFFGISHLLWSGTTGLTPVDCACVSSPRTRHPLPRPVRLSSAMPHITCPHSISPATFCQV